jgi:LuxR family transcriptional regulator, maltose regulon positive regulatory protein
MRDTGLLNTIKTTAPTLDGVIERPRLLNALTQLTAASKWLQAPSGTGKSTLAASYARSSSKPFAWYRLDERDNDPAFFFDEFARAVGTQLALGESLPKFGSDDHDRQQEFAHRFAAALSAQLVEPALLVLDDVQRVTSEDMQLALAALITVAVNGGELLFVSESTAPTAFFDAIAGRQLALLNDADLRFNSNECKTMTAALRVGDTHSEGIAALTGGHAGALVLACELLRGSDPSSALGAATAERIHLHLLTKLIDRMPPARRELLMQTAFVALVTRPIAEALAGSDAARELDPLVDSGLLRRVRARNSEMFEAHGLVRQGMQALVRTRQGEAEARALAERTATVLSGNDQPEAAFALLTEIGSITRAIEELRLLAERYARLGQSDLLLSSIARLPAGEVHSDAWLCFWTGQALLRVDEDHAREWFGYAYVAFETSSDAYGMRLAAASIVTAFGLETGDLRELDVWIERHKRVTSGTPIEAGDRFEASMLMGVMCAAFVRGIPPPNADTVIARMRSLVDLDSPWFSDDQRVQAARLLIEYGIVFSNLEQGRLFAVATRFVIDQALGSVLHRGRWLIAGAQAFVNCGLVTESREFLDQARSLAELSKSVRLLFELGLFSADHWMKAQEFDHAESELKALENIASKVPPAQRAEYTRMNARLLLLQQRLPEGLQWAEEARRMAVPAGYSEAYLRSFDVELTYALAANNRLADAISVVAGIKLEPREPLIAIEHCLRFLHDGATDLQLLRTGLLAARQIVFLNLLDRARGPLAQICASALANDIERDFVLRLINVKGIKPPVNAGPTWPWPVHVRTLGGFRLDIDGRPYQPTHKAQDKPLELLKLLVTCQTLGRQSADKTWATERLWPQAESENARKSLDMTVGRLRRLLGRDDAIVSNEGRLQLSPLHVWTDVAPFLRALSNASARRDDYTAGKRGDVREATASVTAVLEHYTGPYLADEDGPPWLLAGREAMASAVRHALLTADALLEGDSDQLLIPALEKAFAVDPTSEDLARSLMRAHLRQGHNSEVVRVHRRLRETLSLLLGIAPSAETDDIRQQAYAAEASVSAAKPSLSTTNR